MSASRHSCHFRGIKTESAADVHMQCVVVYSLPYSVRSARYVIRITTKHRETLFPSVLLAESPRLKGIKHDPIKRESRILHTPTTISVCGWARSGTKTSKRRYCTIHAFRFGSPPSAHTFDLSQFFIFGVSAVRNHTPTQAEQLVLLVEEEEISREGEDGSTADIDELNVFTAAAMLEEAERLENSAREAGAFPKGW